MQSDEELFEAVRGGETEAFAPLYARYETSLFGFLLALVKNRADAEDLFHEAFLRTLKSDAVRLEPGGFRAYLYAVARNLALNEKRREVRGNVAFASLPEADREPPPDARLQQGELERALRRAVSSLPPTLVELFHLRSAGMSYEQMAEVLEVPVGTVKSRMHQLVSQLKKEVKPWTVP